MKCLRCDKEEIEIYSASFNFLFYYKYYKSYDLIHGLNDGMRVPLCYECMKKLIDSYFISMYEKPYSVSSPHFYVMNNNAYLDIANINSIKHSFLFFKFTQDVLSHKYIHHSPDRWFDEVIKRDAIIDKVESYFTFTYVENPVTRLIRYYINNDYEDFGEFLDEVENNLINTELKPQYLSLPSFKLDFIDRFENIYKSWPFKEIKLITDDNIYNANEISDEYRKRIYDIYTKDFDYLGYNL